MTDQPTEPGRPHPPADIDLAHLLGELEAMARCTRGLFGAVAAIAPPSVHDDLINARWNAGHMVTTANAARASYTAWKETQAVLRGDQ